jgi:hypothetical protein
MEKLSARNFVIIIVIIFCLPAALLNGCAVNDKFLSETEIAIEEKDTPIGEENDNIFDEVKENNIVIEYNQNNFNENPDSSAVIENEDFFQYLGMTYADLEKEFGVGRLSVFQHELGYVTYEFGNNSIVFIFSEPDEDMKNERCQTLVIPLNEVIQTSATRMTKAEFEKHFTIEIWDTEAEEIDISGIWGKVYSVYGKYKNRHFNMYLDGNNSSNKNSVSLGEKVYFYLNI